MYTNRISWRYPSSSNLHQRGNFIPLIFRGIWRVS